MSSVRAAIEEKRSAIKEVYRQVKLERGPLLKVGTEVGTDRMKMDDCAKCHKEQMGHQGYCFQCHK